MTVLGLNPDTTYYFNVGSLWSGATTYSGTQPSTFDVDESTQSVCCECFELNRGCELAGVCFRIEHGHGARLRTRCVTSPNFITYTSSTTTAVAQSTLTISGLTPFTTYYLRAGAANWDSYVNFVNLSTQTSAGAAPGGVTLDAVYITSATLSWTAVSGSNGYEIDASSMQFTSGIVLSTVTTNNVTTSLTVLGLNPDTTYYFNVGSLWSGATTYSATQPSTSTWTNLLTPVVFSVSSSTVVVNSATVCLGIEHQHRTRL